MKTLLIKFVLINLANVRESMVNAFDSSLIDHTRDSVERIGLLIVGCSSDLLESVFDLDKTFKT
jgi:hypothetical protein